MTESTLQRIFEVYPPPSRATIPLGIRVNDMVFAGGVAGTDRVSGEPAADLKGQMALALDHLRDLLERAGGSLDNIARATGFVTSAEDREPIYDPWDALFPDPTDRPAFKSLIAPLPPGQLVQLDVVALIGERRHRIDIPNVPARDPTVRTGNWLFSSRCHGNDQTSGQIVVGGLEAETRQTLENLSTLTRLAGGSEANITQLTMFGRDSSYFAAARGVFEERFSNPSSRPGLIQLVNFVSTRHAIAIEMVAEL